jgi:transcriptional regulator with XRE-family HTH domain
MGEPTATGPAPSGPTASPAARERPAKPLLRTMLGDVLRRRRLHQGRTLADVARAASISMPYLSELERGRKEASSEIIAAICEALGVELSDVLASVESQLTGQRRHGQIIRLEATRDRRSAPAAGGTGDVVCLLAA